MLSDGSYGIIKSIKEEKLSEPETTYNFEVEDFHTYYVGESEVLVHNACMLDPNDIKYSQDSISNKFGKNTAHAGESVDDLIESLKNGAITPNDIEPLDVFIKNGHIYSMNNRRLFAYKMAGVKSVPVRWVPESNLRHVITGNGVDIIVRGGSRFL